MNRRVRVRVGVGVGVGAEMGGGATNLDGELRVDARAVVALLPHGDAGARQRQQ